MLINKDLLAAPQTTKTNGRVRILAGVHNIVVLFSWELDFARRAVSSLGLWGILFCAVGPLTYAASPVVGDLQAQVAQRELSGDLNGARTLLEQRSAQGTDIAATEALAKFLDRHHQAGGRNAYLQWASEEKDAAKQKLALKQAVLLDFRTENEVNLKADLQKYRAAGGTDLALPGKAQSSRNYSTVAIPGPLSSFARMAALSPDLRPEELLPALARNIATNGYQASGNETLDQTEYLRLLIRYIGQARELQSMTGNTGKITVPACDSEQTGNLLKVVGYRMRGSCGADIVLETVNPTRAFLTIDSGFPLTQLEQDLRANRRFELPYGTTSVPVLYNAAYWLSALERNNQGDFLDGFLSDPSICRMYLGLSHLDRETANAIRTQVPAPRLKLYGHVLDFYGSMFRIRNGAAVVPGSPKVWTSLVGASPNNPGAFFGRLIARDDGWLASYFDALSRVEGLTAAYLNDPNHTRRFYEALRGKLTTPGPARPVFRSSTDLLLLTTSLRLDANGQPHVPGNIDVWRTLFVKHPHGKYDAKLTRSANNWRTNDDLLEALFALSRKTVDNEPLKIFLTLNDIDRGRPSPISAQLAGRLVAGYRPFGAQYVLFADEPSLSESSILQCLEMFSAVGGIRDAVLKADEVGTVQSLVEIWKILCRQNAIDPAAQNETFAKLIALFGRMKSESEVFNAGRSGIKGLVAAATHRTSTGSIQDQLVTLLVGNLRLNDGDGIPSPAESFLRIFDAQRLLPLDSLFLVADSQGKKIDSQVMKHISDQMARLEEAQSMRSSLSVEERTAMALGYWSDRHIDQERKLDLQSLVDNPEKKDARSALAPFLRDSLVGIVYCYYAPIGAQILLTNPSFVRSHDFLGPQGTPMAWRTTEVSGSGWPSSAGGRLMGSLVGVPYALAEAEQNFLTPKREQALIWGDLAPQIMVDQTVTRWRNITPEQLRWASLNVERGKYLLASAALDPTLKPHVADALGRFLNPGTVEQISDYLQAGRFHAAEALIPTSEFYFLAGDLDLRELSPSVDSIAVADLAAQSRPDLSPAAIARVFGSPKPTLTHSYQPGLLHLRTFPALMGYSSRILAESWESDNFFYASLADQAGVPIDQLDAYVPQWNRATVENIFATHLEDWPALLRSLHTVGDRVLQQGQAIGDIKPAENNKASDLSMN